MADLYINPQGQLINNDSQSITGNEKIDKYLNTLPAEQREGALKKITAPLNGEEIAKKLKEDINWIPNKQEFDLFNKYQSQKETDIVDGLSLFTDAASAMYDIAGNVISSTYDHPLENALKIAPSILEGGVQNIRNWYGMLAQSQDPSSVLFKWKNVLLRDGSDDAYKQFLEARDFARESVGYETGEKTMLVNKDYIDPALTQAAAIIVDPMFYGSFLVGGGGAGVTQKVAQILGMSERLAKASAFAEKMKGAVYGGALKYGVGVPLEFIGDITRGTIDKAVEGGSKVLEGATGVSAQDIKTATKVGGFGSIATGVPYLSPTSKVYLGAGFSSGLGEALSATGEQIMKNGGKRGLLSFAEQAIAESDAMLAKGGSGLTPQARKLLNVINKADPMFSYAGSFLEGGAHGAVVGGALGYLGGGEEGAWGGAGAGFGIGSLGGVAGRAMSNIGGGLEKQRLAVQMDMLMPMLKDTDPNKYSAIELLRKASREAGNPDWVVDRYAVALDKIAPASRMKVGGKVAHEAELRAKGQDPKIYDGYERDANGEYKLDKDGNKIRLRDAEGFTIPTVDEYNRAAGFTIQSDINNNIKIHINTDKIGEIKNTLPHELFHAVFRELGMKNEFKDRIAEHILGTFDEKGNQIKPPSISKFEAESFFTKYINSAYAGTDKQERLAKLKQALDEYYSTGKMTVMESDGVTPVLHHLNEEFGAYYWTHFLNDKPVDYLFRGGELEGIRGVLDSIKNRWQDYMERKVGGVNGGFDFARDKYINPSFKDKDGKRIRVSALDYMMQDLIRTKSAASRGQAFDFNKLSPEGQEAYVNASGNSIAFEPPKVKGGKYKVRTAEQQKKIRVKRADAMHKGLEAFRTSNPEMLRVRDANGNDIGGLSPDADGNYTGLIPDAILDYFVKSGHIDKVEAERIKLLQKAARGETSSNVFEFIEYTGETMHTGIDSNVRAKSPYVPTKNRVVILTNFETKITPNDYGFYAHTLDYRHLQFRQDNLWKDPKVRAAWGDDKDAFTADLFRYFKNASQPDGVRLPSAQLWSENGEYKRNVLHQVAGLETPASGTLNPSLGDIKGDMFSTYRQFRTDRMSQERMGSEKIHLQGKDAIDYIRHNMMPSEMSNEPTPNGHIYTHPNGYKFFKTENGIKAVKPDGSVVGIYKTMEEAVKKSDIIYQKENPNGKPIPSVDNIRQEPFDPPETLKQYIERKLNNLFTTSEENISSILNWKPNNELTNLIESKDFQNFLNNHDASLDIVRYNHIIDKQQTTKNTVSKYLEVQYNKEQQAVNPTFVSGLSVALDKILSANVNKEGTIQASRLLNLMDRASGGDIGKILTESNAIGFTDWLKSKKDSRVSEAEIRQYIKDNGIKVSLDPRTDIRGNEWYGGGFDTSRYTAEGKRDGYYTFVARINPEHAHGVEGHFGGDSIVHIRATTRTDAQGRKVLFVEEIQSINTAREELSPSQRSVVQSEIKSLKELKNIASEFNKVSKLHYESKGTMLKRALDIARKEGIEVLKEYEMKGEVTNDFRKLVDIIASSDILKLEKIPKLSNNSSIEIMRDGKYEIKRLVSERESQLAKVKSNKPLQDFNETVKIASRTIMRKAVELGADRVVLVRPEDMHPDVSTNAEGERFVDTLYGRDIPAMMNAELKKYGKKLAPARNYGNQDPNAPIKLSGRMVGSSDKLYSKEAQTKQILSESLGYDITQEMKQKAGRSQTFMMPSENSDIIYTGRRFVGQVKGGMWATRDFKRLENAGGIKAYRISPDARVLVLHKTKFDKNGNYLYSDVNKSGFNELRKIALESNQDLDFWDNKEQLFSNPELLDGDSLFPSLDTDETMRMSDNEIEDKNAEFPEQQTRNSINKRDLLQAVKDAGYDIIKTTNIEGEATLVLNKNAVTPLTVDDKLPTHYMPSEGEYRSGDNYWKAKENKFEGVDENGQTYRLASAIINGKVEFNPDPDNVSWMDIGHSNMRMPNQKVYEAGNLRNKPVTSPDDYMAKMRDGLWAIASNKPNDVMMYKPPANARPRLEAITHDEWLRGFREGGHGRYIYDITTGRYEKPIYKDGKLIERGRLSMQAYGEITSLEQAKKIKEQVAKKLGFKSEDFDAYVFDSGVKEKLGISRKDQLPIKFMPAESSEPIPFKDFIAKTEQEVGAAWSLPFYKKLEGSVISGADIGNLRILKVTEDKNKQPKLTVINEEKYQKILKNYPEGKPRDNEIRQSAEEYKAWEFRKGEFRHPLFTLQNNIENIKFDASSAKPVKQVTFNAQAISSAVSSIADDLIGMEFDKTSTTTLFGRKSKTGEVKGIIQNLQDAVQELNKARTPEEKSSAVDKVNSYVEELRSLKDELQDKHDNTPESFQETDTYTNREEAIDALDNAITDLENSAEDTSGGSTGIKNMMPAEGEQGGRTYTNTEFNSLFIGRYAQQNKDLLKNLTIKVTEKSDGFEVRLYDQKSKTPSLHIGSLKIDRANDSSSASIENADINGSYRNKGIGKLLYSEAVERLRSLGVTDVDGMIVDEFNRPVKIRKKIIDEENNRIENKTRINTNGRTYTSAVRTDDYGNQQKDVSSTLRQDAYYMPSEQAQAWRDFKAEPTTEGNSIFKNAMNFVIIQANKKYKVYNPQKALLGIYTDLDQAKRRVQREEPKQR
jgi:hypothetical protein